MATRFELVLCGSEPIALRAAGEEALAEIERLEDQLSLFRPGSEIADVNARAAREPVRVSAPVFDLLQRARELTLLTDGAFDITVAPLVRCWGFMGGKGRIPSADEIAQARAVVGMDNVQLDPAHRTVRFARPGVMLDLGAIGKGYAVERAVEVLRDAGVPSALLHGGTSTVYALGEPPDGPSWQIALEQPPALLAAPDLNLPLVTLRDEALSVSAIWGRAFETGDQLFGHVLDPRTGAPVRGALLSAVVLPSATDTDALSTALLTLGPKGHDLIARAEPGIKTLLAWKTDGQFRVESNGI